MPAHRQPFRLVASNLVYIRRSFWYPARRSQRIVLHHADCRYCRCGLGVSGRTARVGPDHPLMDFPKTAWIGPFVSLAAANAWLRQFPYARGRLAERCSYCCKVPESWPPR